MNDYILVINQQQSPTIKCHHVTYSSDANVVLFLITLQCICVFLPPHLYKS